MSSDDTPALQVRPHELRTLIDVAVERAVRTAVADRYGDLTQRVQVAIGMATQLNTDYRLLQDRINDIAEVVLGNEKTKTPGLVEQVALLNKAINTFNAQLSRINDYWRAVKWVLGLLVSLGLLNNDFLVSLFTSLIK